MSKRVALYLRVSTLDQHPETQRYDLRQMAQQRGLEIVEEYVDHGISGTRARRPALDQMMADARRGRFYIVLVTLRTRIEPPPRSMIPILTQRPSLFLLLL